MPKYPRYTKEEECALWERMHAGDTEAREQLVMSMLDFAHAIAIRAAIKRIPDDDARSLSHLGIMDAVDSFDPARGRLSTHTWFHVRKHVLKESRERSGIIRVPAEPRVGPEQSRVGQFARDVLPAWDPRLSPPGCCPVAGRLVERELQPSRFADALEAAEHYELLEIQLGLVEWYCKRLSARDHDLLITSLTTKIPLRSLGKLYGISHERVRQIKERHCRRLQELLGHEVTLGLYAGHRYLRGRNDACPAVLPRNPRSTFLAMRMKEST